MQYGMEAETQPHDVILRKAGRKSYELLPQDL